MAIVKKVRKEGVFSRRYTFKLYPNKEQTAALELQARMVAELWNALLQMREESYRRQLVSTG